MVVGRPIAYSRFSEALLAANSDLAHIAASLDHGPLSEHVDMNLMRDIHPNIVPFRSWLARTGQSALNLALAKS